jgi:hypothetical protein
MLFFIDELFVMFCVASSAYFWSITIAISFVSITLLYFNKT